MSITKFFITRPVATTLLALAVYAGGLTAYALLPVSALPQIDFPTISVSASLPGASPKTMAASVATPLERSIGAIAGITEMTSASGLGTSSVTIQFDLSRDINGAARDVQAAINAAMSDLPSNLPGPPTYRQVNPADAPIMLLALTSDTLRPEQLYDLASSILAPRISQVEGVGQVVTGGGSLPAVRVEVVADRLLQHGVSMADLGQAIGSHNSFRPQGAVEYGDRYWQIAGNGPAMSAEEYAPLVVSWDDGAAMRLFDVAAVRDSVQDVHNAGLANGRHAVILVIFRSPGANIIKAVDAVGNALPRLTASIPEAVNVEVLFDRTGTIRASLRDVMRTLCIAVALVVLVVFLFLLSPRATLIPGIAVTASLVGTFAGMYFCGFSLDNLSLMALAVATGFVVDDAIVVLENISRHSEAGSPPLRAALEGSGEVSFTVLSMTLSLVAVFIPLLFMRGIVGRLFREFALTLSMAIGISLVLSLALTPMLCSRLLGGKKVPRARFAALKSRAEDFHASILGLYTASLARVLKHRRITLVIWGLTAALTVWLYIVVPKGFFPEQDTGMIRGSLLADRSISFQALKVKLAALMDAARADPAVASVAGYTGSTSSAAFIAIALKPRSERDVSAEEVIARLRNKVNRQAGVQLFMVATQDINVGGRSSRALYQYTLQGNDLDALQHWAQVMQNAMLSDPIFKDINNDLESGGLETAVLVDRDTASRLGVTMNGIDAALGNAFSQRTVSTMYGSHNQYRVVLVADDSLWQGPEGLGSVYVPSGSGSGALAPLSAMASFNSGKTPVRVNHQGLSPSATISFNLAPGASLSQATERIAAIRRSTGMPHSILATFQGTAKEFERSLAGQPMLIMTAIFCVYVVLGVLYESWVHPITILSTLPPAGIGALLALRLFGMDFSVIALIGVLLLAGIVKKNAIMLIDFAVSARRNEGLDPEAGISKACALRFRPIMMTTMAAMLGALPLAIGFGDGSELRRPLGISIVGGLLFSQLLTLYTTPVVYLYLDRLNSRWNAMLRRGFGRAVPAMAKDRGA